MARKQTKVHKGTLFATLLMVSLTLLFLPQKITSNLNLFFIDLFKPFLSIGIDGPRQFFHPANPNENFVSRIEYDKLWTAYKNIEADLHTLMEDYEKVSKYRAFMPGAGPAILPAKIITYQPSEYLFIDRGSEHGLKPGLYVLGADSIIGTIAETSSATSRVKLLTSKTSMIPVRIQREGKLKYIMANMSGNGMGKCKVSLVSREKDVKPGDAVYAAPVSGILASSRVIGEVSSAWPAENDPLLWDISVSPIYSAEQLSDVAIVIMDPQ